jgi:hypothetical protein
MVRVVTSWCVGLLFGLGATLAAGQAEGEKPKGPSRQYSKPVRAGGVDFEVVAETVWRRPAEVYGVGEANVGLRISNRSDKDFTFDLGDNLRVSLKPADGPELVSGPVPKRFLPKPLKVAAGKSETVTLPTHLFHTRIRHVCLGLDSGSGWNWLTRDVLPGKYRLGLSFENKQKGNDAWRGKMQTEALEIEVKAAK